LASGFPIGGIIAHKDIMGQWIPGAHASTFGGNPIAAAAANATIEVIQQEGLLHNSSARGAYAIERLNQFAQNHPSIVRVEGRGLMVGIEFADQHGKPIPKFRDEVVNKCYLNGLLTLGAGASVLRIAPPLMISQQLMEQGLDIMEHAIAETEEAFFN
jgi:4-aminobutyrate aminotransferase